MSESLQPKRGEIWSVNLGPEVEGGHLVIIMSADELGTLEVRTCIPLGKREPHHDDQFWQFPLEPDRWNSLSFKSSANTIQIRPIATSRFLSKLGRVDADALEDIVAVVAMNLGFRGY
ncbi:hypothetical protein IAD21_00510 [Abditibacteriota bacterium]|nr:hypothetical protein IAD21_00510 [Abditibacteriota bacterium]